MSNKSLKWYLLREASLLENETETEDNKNSGKKPEPKKGKMKSTGVDPSKYGQPLPPRGRYKDELNLLIQQMNKKFGTQRLTSDQPNELFKRLGQRPTSRGWNHFFSQQIGKTNSLGDIIRGNGGDPDGPHVVKITLDSDWKNLASDEQSSRRFLCFYFSQILKAMGMKEKSNITMSNFEFRLSGNIVSIVQTKAKS